MSSVFKFLISQTSPLVRTIFAQSTPGETSLIPMRMSYSFLITPRTNPQCKDCLCYIEIVGLVWCVIFVSTQVLVKQLLVQQGCQFAGWRWNSSFFLFPPKIRHIPSFIRLHVHVERNNFTLRACYDVARKIL